MIMGLYHTMANPFKFHHKIPAILILRIISVNTQRPSIWHSAPFWESRSSDNPTHHGSETISSYILFGLPSFENSIVFQYNNPLVFL